MAAWQRMEYPRDKGACYRLLGGQLAALMEGERDALANLANAAALIYQALPDLNWAGFYLYKQGMLVLGPFQGMPAASRSEIVVPLLDGDRLLGVLDVDSPLPARFDESDREGLEALARRLTAGCDWDA